MFSVKRIPFQTISRVALKNIALRQFWNGTRRERVRYLPALTSGVFGLFLGGLGYAAYQKIPNPDLLTIQKVHAEALDIAEPIHPPKVSSLENLPDLIEKILPAVGTVNVLLRGRMANGSGFFISGDGLFLTNYHVLAFQNSPKIEIRLHDGSICPAVLLGADAEADLAVLKVIPPRPREFPFLKFADINSIRQGEFVVALGSPHFFDNSVTFGVVSCKSRQLTLVEGLWGKPRKPVTYVQTDAAITNGNSGGPLVNLRGEVIGINTLRLEAGLSFAVSIENTQKLLTAVSKRDPTSSEPRIKHSYPDFSKTRQLGITVMDINDETWQLMRRTPFARDQYYHWTDEPDPHTHGVYVRSVLIPSAASRAGIRPGDIITHVNSQPIQSAKDLQSMLSENATVSIQVTRGNSILEFSSISLSE